TGALIALECRSARMMNVFRAAVLRRSTITVPAVVIAGWWRVQRGTVASPDRRSFARHVSGLARPGCIAVREASRTARGKARGGTGAAGVRRNAPEMGAGEVERCRQEAWVRDGASIARRPRS